MGVKSSGADDLAKALDRFADLLSSQRLMNKVGLAARRHITRLTRSGLDFEEKAFPTAPTAEAGSPYSPGHRKKRLKADLPINKKNLRFTEYDSALGHLDHVVARDFVGVVVLIEDPEKAQIIDWLEQGAGSSKVKHAVMGLSDRNRSRINDLLGIEVDEYLRITNLT